MFAAALPAPSPVPRPAFPENRLSPEAGATVTTGTRLMTVVEGGRPMPRSIPTPAETERMLIRRAKAGDAAAFAPLVAAHRDRLYRFVLRITRNTHDADDIAQRAFINAWKHIARFDEDRPFSNWLFGIAYKDAIKVVTRRRPTTDLPELMADDDATPDELASRSETPVWDLARRELSAERHAMLRLHYADGVPLADIAKITGRTVVSVKVHLFRARGILRDRLAAMARDNHDRPSRTSPR